MKIDAFNHIITPKYNDARLKSASPQALGQLQAMQRAMPALFDLDLRFHAMDVAGDGYVQILNTANPPVETFATPEQALELSVIANDEMAELVARHPDRFIGAVACLPMNHMKAALDELERSVKKLGLLGAQVYTDVAGRPLDDPEFAPLFDKLVELDVPMLLHPVRGPNRPDYPSEKMSRFDTWRIFGWLYDTVSAMARLAFSGVFDRHPDIRILTHHLGGFVPYATERIREGYDKLLKAARISNEPAPLPHHPHDYFHKFYADTITIGSVPALECGLDFFGTDRVLFATDMPFDTMGGVKYVEVAVGAMERIDLPEAEKTKIYEGNARKFFKLP